MPHYKQVRTLVKIGYFSYDQNIQVDGRINRYKSITGITQNDATDAISEAQAAKAAKELKEYRVVKTYFIIPETSSSDAAKCYEAAYDTLNKYSKFYEDVMQQLYMNTTTYNLTEYLLTNDNASTSDDTSALEIMQKVVRRRS